LSSRIVHSYLYGIAFWEVYGIGPEQQITKGVLTGFTLLGVITSGSLVLNTGVTTQTSFYLFWLPQALFCLATLVHRFELAHTLGIY